MNILLQAVKMSDEVTVSSLPHPISMFFLGIFAVTIIYVVIESNRVRRDWEKIKHSLDGFNDEFKTYKSGVDAKINEISKKIDSRVDKALVNISKKNVL
jgi:hypothetical protein